MISKAKAREDLEKAKEKEELKVPKEKEEKVIMVTEVIDLVNMIIIMKMKRKMMLMLSLLIRTSLTRKEIMIGRRKLNVIIVINLVIFLMSANLKTRTILKALNLISLPL